METQKTVWRFPTWLEIAKQAWNDFKKLKWRAIGIWALFFGFLAATALIVWLLFEGLGAVGVLDNKVGMVLAFIIAIVFVLLFIAFMSWFVNAQLRLVVTAVSVRDVYKRSWTQVLSTFFIAFLTGLSVLIGGIFFVVPGIILGILLMFSLVALVSEDLKGFAALKRSYSLVKFNFWTVVMKSLGNILIVTAIGAAAGIVSFVLMILFILPLAIVGENSIYGIIISGVLTVLTMVVSLISRFITGWFSIFYKVVLYKNLVHAYELGHKVYVETWKKILVILGFVLTVILFVAITVAVIWLVRHDPVLNNYGGATSGLMSKDSDNDGLTDDEEKSYKTDPNIEDTDGDGQADGMEILLGRDPLKED